MKPFTLTSYYNEDKPEACEYHEDPADNIASTFKLEFGGMKDPGFACPKCLLGYTPKIICAQCEQILGYKVLTSVDEDEKIISGICEDCLEEAKGVAEDNFEDEQERLDEQLRAKKLKTMESVWQ